MTLWRRGSVVISLAMLAAALSNAPAAAHTFSPAHYFVSCSNSTDGTSNYNPQAFVKRPTSGWGSFKAIKSQVILVEPLHPCTPTASVGGFSLVNAVNFFHSTGSTNASGQLGYAVQACATNTGCQGGDGQDCLGANFTSGVMDFWYTKNDHDLSIARACWVDFNNDGIHDTPVVGTKYEFEIDYGEFFWEYCVTPRSGAMNGESSCITESKTANTGYMSDAYWSFELYNDASAFASDAGDGSTVISPMQYMNSNGSIFTTVNTTGNTCSWQPGSTWPQSVSPYHWASEVCGVDNQGANGAGRLFGYQAWHS